MNEVYKCPSCVDELLVKLAGNLLVCQSCEVIYVEPQNVNNMIRVEVLTNRDPGDETEYP